MVQITGRPQKPKQESILRSDSFCLQDMFTKKIKIRGKRGRTEVKSKHITKESLNLDEKAGGDWRLGGGVAVVLVLR